MTENLCLTLLFAAGVGLIALKLKLPGGVMIGAVIGTCILNFGFEAAYMPMPAKVTAQIVSGAFIGSMMKREELLRLKGMYKAAAIILGSLCMVNLVSGFIAWYVSPYDLLTMLMCTIPGGISDVSLIAADMGADMLPVVITHFCRIVMGIGVFPFVIARMCKDERKVAENRDTNLSEANPKDTSGKKEKKQGPGLSTTAVTLGLATVLGLLGRISGVPAGTLVFSMVGITIVRVFVGYDARLPMPLKRLAQVLSGAYIGCAITKEALTGIHGMILPILLVMLIYVLNSLLVSAFIHKKFGISRAEAMFMLTPAGASDMALIASDMGIHSAALIVVQVLRLFVADAILPTVCHLIAVWTGL